MDRSEDPGDHPRPDRAGALRPPGPLLLVSGAGVIVFVALTVYAALGQRWPLFFVSCVLTAIAAAYAIMEVEYWRRGDDHPGN